MLRFMILVTLYLIVCYLGVSKYCGISVFNWFCCFFLLFFELRVREVIVFLFFNEDFLGLVLKEV